MHYYGKEKEEADSVGRIKYGADTLYLNSAKARLTRVVQDLEESEQCESDVAQAIFGLEIVLKTLKKRRDHLT